MGFRLEGSGFRAAMHQYIGFRVLSSGCRDWGNKPPSSRNEQYSPYYTMVQYWVGLLLGGVGGVDIRGGVCRQFGLGVEFEASGV